MTASASLMLILALRFAGVDTAASLPAASALLNEFGDHQGSFLVGRTHFVFLGGGSLHGIAAEGALKLEEMSLAATETYFPLEYRHGPISVIDRRSLVVMLYHPDTRDEEERLARELSSMGAFVIGFGGAGDLRLEVDGPVQLRGLVCLPALQLLGAQLARLRGLIPALPVISPKSSRRPDQCRSATTEAAIMPHGENGCKKTGLGLRRLGASHGYHGRTRTTVARERREAGRTRALQPCRGDPAAPSPRCRAASVSGRNPFLAWSWLPSKWTRGDVWRDTPVEPCALQGGTHKNYAREPPATHALPGLRAVPCDMM